MEGSVLNEYVDRLSNEPAACVPSSRQACRSGMSAVAVEASWTTRAKPG